MIGRDEECWGRRKRLGRSEGERPYRRGEGRERLTDRMTGGRGGRVPGEGGQDRHREAVRGMETRASSWDARGGARCWGQEAPAGKRQAEVVWREDGKVAAPAMAGAVGREASGETGRAEWEAAARALAGAMPSW
jgi:hypothetical protein